MLCRSISDMAIIELQGKHTESVSVLSDQSSETFDYILGPEVHFICKEKDFKYK